ncbi:MAG TPA: alpha/beta fold hydrolase [Candidatus Aquilonibacter sp.]
MNERAIAIPARDGLPLPATLVESEFPSGAVVIVSPATATPRGFYHAFCRYLAQLGATAITYDYRGTFEEPRELGRSTARMRDWGELDFAGVVDWASKRYPGAPLHTVGHSVGGHVLLMAPNADRVTRAVNVASQSGYWRLYRGVERYRVYAFVKAIMPAITRTYGYFPGARLVFGTNLAPGVLYQWSRWCVCPNYFFDDPCMADLLGNAARFTAPTLMIGLADDPWATPQAIDAMEHWFSGAHVTRREIDPRVLGVAPIGHMGFFRSANASLWPAVTDALELRQPAPTYVKGSS